MKEPPPLLAAAFGRFAQALREYREAVRLRDLRRLEQDFLPPLLEIQDTPPTPHKRMVLWSLLLLLVIALAWSSVARIDVVATASGRFVPDGRLKVVQPAQPGVVRAILVEAGQLVHAGDTLLELDAEPLVASREAVEQHLGLNEFKQRRLAGQLAGRAPDRDEATVSGADITQRGIWRAELDAHRSQLRNAAAAVREAQADLAAAEELLPRQQHALAIAEEQAANARVLADLGALARNDYLQSERDRLAQEAELATRREKVVMLRARLVAAREALAQLDAQRRLRLLDQMEAAEQQRIALAESRVRVAHHLAAQRLHSPVDGTVQAVNVTSIGAVVVPQQEVVTIVPRDAPLLVEIRVLNQDAGFVEAGQAVEIKVDAFPFVQYGVLPGRIAWISPDAEVDERLGSYYRARVEVERPTLDLDGRKMTVRAGMTVTVDVRTGERRVIEFFLSPLLKNLRESLSVR